MQGLEQLVQRERPVEGAQVLMDAVVAPARGVRPVEAQQRGAKPLLRDGGDAGGGVRPKNEETVAGAGRVHFLKDKVADLFPPAGVELRAGESTYTELGADAGFLGMLLFAAWSIALLARLVARARGAPRAEAWASAAVAASLAAVLALAVQTDVLGVPWLSVCVWWLAGSLAAPLALPAAQPAPRPTPLAERTRPLPPAEARP